MANSAQYILPVVGAVIGGVIGESVQGAQIGWMIGSYAGAALMKRSGDANVQDMPVQNNATRGTTIFLTFGANRVSSAIGWTKNYTPVLHNSGGKGGGSGGAGGPAGKQPYYTYNWDVMYVFGMVDKPVFVRNAWVSGKRIELVTTQTWASALPLALTTIFPFLVSSSKTKQKTVLALTSSETFFAPGYATGDANLQTWTYFSTQENSVQCAFPYISWLGFKQLDLGPAPHLPQLMVELVPLGNAAITAGALGYISKASAVDLGSSTIDAPLPTGDMMMLGENGKHYVVARTNDRWDVVCVETGVGTQVTSTMVTNALANSSHTVWGGGVQCLIPVPGKAQFFAVTYDIHSSGLKYYVGIANFKIDVNGAIVAYRYIIGLTVGLANGLTGFCMGVSRFEAGTVISSFGPEEDDVIFAVVNTSGVGIGTDQVSMWRLPLNTFLDYPGLGIQNWETADVVNMTVLGQNFFAATVGGDLRNHNYQRATPIQVAGAICMLAYIDKSLVDTTISAGNAIIDAITSPEFILCDGPSVSHFSIGSDPLVNFIDLPDAMKKYDDTAATNYYDDYSSPTLIAAGGGQYLVFARGFTTKAEYQRIRVYYLTDAGTSASMKATNVAVSTGRTIDVVTNLGVGSGNRDIAYPYMVQAGYNVAAGKLWTMAYHRAQLAVDTLVWSEFGDFTPVAGDEDVTPAYIIYRALTSDVFGAQASALFGFTISPARIDQTSYLAAHNFCIDQGIKVATTFANYDNFLSILDSTLNLFGGYLIDVAGMIYFGVSRDTDDTLRTVDNKHLIGGDGKPPVKITEPALQDTFNKVSFGYIDRKIDYKPNQVQIADEVDVDLNGPRPVTYPARWVMAGSLAQMQAERVLWTNLYGRRLFEFKVGWKDFDLIQGDVITLVDSFDTSLQTGKKVRIIRRVEEHRGQWAITAREHIPIYLTAKHSFTDAISWTPTNYISTPQNVTARMYELPKEMQTNGPRTYVGYNQLSTLMGAQLYLSGDGSNYTLADNIIPYCVSGLFPEALPTRAPGYMEENIHIYLMPSSPFNIATPTYVQTHAMADVTQAMRSAGSGVIITGSEAIGFEGLTLVGQNHYRVARMFRGWAGTPINPIGSGDLWHYHNSGIFEHPIAENDIGNIIYYKVIGYNFANEIFSVASTSARTYAVKGLYWLPRAQTPVQLWVDSPVAYSNSLAVVGPFLNTISGGCNVQLTWPGAAQAEGYGAGGYGGARPYGHFAADITSPTYRVDVYSSNGVAVSSFVANTGYLSYTRAQNSADFNGFGKSVIFKVTPYNVKGDGPTSAVRSLNTFY